MKGSEPPRWLLIGNSRWHWGWPDPACGGISVRHSSADDPLGDPSALLAWAAVGSVPDGPLPAASRIDLAAVPLKGLPAWIGIDRALAGWLAWRRTGGPVLVADAGTVLSLTWVDGDGHFRGGRLLAGAALQLRAMAQGTAALPALPPDGSLTAEAISGAEPWPQATVAAMGGGVWRGLAAAIAAANRDLLALEPEAKLVISGGDGPALLALLLERDDSGGALLQPDLALAALAALRPEPGAAGGSELGAG